MGWIAVIFLGCTPLIWFTPGHFLVGPDLHFPLDAARWQELFFAWNPRWGTGFEWSVGFSNLVFYGVSAILSLVVPDLVHVQQGLFVFWFLSAGLTSFWLAMELWPGGGFFWAKLAMTHLYLFNLYQQAIWVGNEAGLAAYTALPLLCVLVLRGLRTRRFLSYGCGLGLASLLLSPASSNLPMMVVAVLTVLIFALVVSWKERALLTGKDLVVFGGWAVVMIVGCNLFWILPQGYVNQARIRMPAFSSEAIAMTQSWLSGISANTSLPNVLRMQGDWTWYQGWVDPYRTYSALYRENPFWIGLSWLWVAGILVGAFIGRHRYSTAFLSMAILGVVLGTGIHPPFGIFYKWAVEHLPYFYVFRSPWFKFTLMTCLGYAFLFGEAVQWMVGKVSRIVLLIWPQSPQRSRAMAMGTGLLLIGLNTLYAFPVLTGKMFPKPGERTKLKPMHIRVPSYVLEAADWLNRQPGFFRVLCLPARVNGASVYAWGLGSTVPALYPFGRVSTLFQAMPSSLDFGNRWAERFCRALYGPMSPHAVQIPQGLSVRYLLHEKDFEFDYFESGPSYPLFGDTPEFVRGRIQSQQGVHFVRAFGPWDIWQVEDPKPHADWADRIVAVVGNPDQAIPIVGDSIFSSPRRVSVFLDGVEDEMEWETLKRAQTLGLLERCEFLTDWVDSLPEELLAWMDNPTIGLGGLYSTEGWTASVSPAAADESPIQIRWTGVGFLREKDSSGEDWLWLTPQPDSSSHLVLVNPTGKPMKTNLQFSVVSFGRDRDLFVYLGDRLETRRLMKDQETQVVIPAIEVSTEALPVRFYTPYAWDTRHHTMVSFGFREKSFRTGRLTFRGEIPSFRTTSAHWAIIPQPILEQWPQAIRVRIEGEEILFHANPSQGRFESPHPIAMVKGKMALEVEQPAVGSYLAVRYFQDAERPLLDTGDPPSLEIVSAQPTLYRFTGKIARPSVLVFRESFFPFWQLTDERGKVVEHRLLADGFGLGFLVEDPTSHHWVLRYTAQDWFELGWRLSVGWVLFCVGWVILAWIRSFLIERRSTS